MKIINGIVLFGMFCLVLLFVAHLFMTGFATSYDVVEYDIGKEYFVYIDNDENIERVSLSENVKIMASDRNYVWICKETFFGLFTTTKYDLYLNESAIGN